MQVLEDVANGNDESKEMRLTAINLQDPTYQIFFHVDERHWIDTLKVELSREPFAGNDDPMTNQLRWMQCFASDKCYDAHPKDERSGIEKNEAELLMAEGESPLSSATTSAASTGQLWPSPHLNEGSPVDNSFEYVVQLPVELARGELKRRQKAGEIELDDATTGHWVVTLPGEKGVAQSLRKLGNGLSGLVAKRELEAERLAMQKRMEFEKKIVETARREDELTKKLEEYPWKTVNSKGELVNKLKKNRGAVIKRVERELAAFDQKILAYKMAMQKQQEAELQALLDLLLEDEVQRASAEVADEVFSTPVPVSIARVPSLAAASERAAGSSDEGTDKGSSEESNAPTIEHQLAESARTPQPAKASEDSTKQDDAEWHVVASKSRRGARVSN